MITGHSVQAYSIIAFCSVTPCLCTPQCVVCSKVPSLLNVVAWCAGYVIAFIYNWKLTLVMTASVPLIALAAIMQVRPCMTACHV